MLEGRTAAWALWHSGARPGSGVLDQLLESAKQIGGRRGPGVAVEELAVRVGEDHERQHHRVLELHRELDDLLLARVGVRGQGHEVLLQERCDLGVRYGSLHEGAALASQLAPELDEDALALCLGRRLRVGPGGVMWIFWCFFVIFHT